MSTEITINQSTIDINVTEQIIVVEAPAGAYPLPSTVSSVFGRTGAVLALNGDYNTSLVTEGSNLYFTNARSRSAISLTTTGTSGAATYNSTTGVFNIPQYQGGVTSFNTRTGAISLLSADVTTALGFTPYNSTNPSGFISGITSANVTTALGYTPVTNARTLTINGTTYDLTADRSWTIATASGTVTSVGLSAPTGFSVTNSPITTNGTLALGFAAGYSLPTNASQTTWNTAYNRSLLSASVTGTTTKTLTLNQQDGGTITASWTDINTDAVTSVFGRTGTVVATNGDYTTSQVTEGTNLYYTDARSRAALSFVAGSGAYNSTTGVLTIPTNNNQITNGAGYITSSALSTYVPYTGATTNLNLGTNNLSANNSFLGFTSLAASGTQLVLTVASVPTYLITGSGGQTIKLPDATTLPNGANYVFNNNQSSGAILVNNNSNTLVVSVPSGGYCTLELNDNTTAAGSWDRHFEAPSNVSWSTNTFDYAGSITSATWNGVTIAPNRGGTGQTTYTDGQLLIGNSTGNTLSKANLSAGTGVSITNGAGTISIASTITQYTDALARASISLTTTGTSGAATYNSTTGVLNIPQYTGGGGMIYPAAGIAVSTGSAWGTSITDNSANWNTAYTNRITSLTTTGSSGSSTLVSNVLNIPTYTLSGLGGQPLATNLTSLAALSYASTSFVKMTASGTFALDTNTYQGTLTLTTIGSSGAATLIGNTLNIPQYSGGIGTISLAAIGSSPNANAATLTGTILNLEPASASFGGVVTTGTQTFAGAKTFSSDLTISGVLMSTITTNRQTASYTLVLTDRGKLIEMNVATANNLTIPLNSSVAFTIGTQIDLSQYGAGQTTVVATSGVTIRSTNSWVKLNAQYAAATLIKIGTDEWYLFGNLNA